MDRQQLLRRQHNAWLGFNESYAGLSERRLLEPGVQGRWSVGDIMAHVTTWEEEALTHLPLILEGGRPPRYSTTYGGIDAFNAMMTERKRDLSLAEVRRQLDEVQGRLVEYIRGVPEEQFAVETRFRRRLRLDTYGHYPKHTRAILAWRERDLLDASSVQRNIRDSHRTNTEIGGIPCSSSTLSARSPSAAPRPR
jgi:hypothetical protein